MNPDSVPTIRRAGPFRAAAIAVLALLILPFAPALSPAAQKHEAGVTWLQGHVDRTTGHSIQFRGRWYELAGATILDAYRKSMPGAQIKNGAYVYIRLENGRVTYLRVFQDLGR